ncbi:unnamed protein product [Effrenium voratum]|uniref:CRAL-TRIO domain-containing protein n=1 Tax=Effrenium voratum TaxID=2562239 RepID=A0AA36JBA4_9DINO|nr:unnamed protein product [Effrenium voratum]CAJ1429089.1 unnamed protein product [Effrenium voratum]
MAEYTLDGADVSWPSDKELAQLQEIRRICAAELAALPNSPRDVVGDIRICRFLRFNYGDVTKAAKGYSEFLKWRVTEKIDNLRKGLIDLSKEEFTEWLDSVRSPFAPALAPFFGETPDGHLIIFASPGYFKASEFAQKRPSCHTMDSDLQLVRASMEYIMKLVDDNCYKRHKVLYTVKLVDAIHLGRETLPIFVPEVRKFMQDNAGQIMAHYCDHDILILMVNAPFIVRLVIGFASTFMSKRQTNRIKVFSSAGSAECQKILKALGPPSMLPESLQGTRKAENIPLFWPLPQDDESRIKEWMARRTAGVTREGATKPPQAAERTEVEQEQIELPATPITNLEDTAEVPETLLKATELKAVEIEEPPPLPESSGWFTCCAAP